MDICGSLNLYVANAIYGLSPTYTTAFAGNAFAAMFSKSISLNKPNATLVAVEAAK